MSEHLHTPVLAEEALALLAPRPGEVAVDGTAGRGGHAVLLAEAVRRRTAPGETGADAPGGGRLIAFDLDAGNLAATRARVERLGVPFTGFHESFVRVPRRLGELGVRADVVLADLGVSSSQLDDPARGFSFREQGPLDMRLDRSARTRTAADLVADLDEAELARLIRSAGEEPLAAKIARKLVQTRRRQPIETTKQLADLVVQAYGPRAHSSRMHPATRTFMALRIAVNEELDALRMLLDVIVRGAEDRPAGWLNGGARVAIISFHSLEDRMVKRTFADLEARDLAARLTRRPVRAGPQEIGVNARARSARLRAVHIGRPADR